MVWIIFPTWSGRNPTCYSITYVAWSEAFLLQHFPPVVVGILFWQHNLLGLVGILLVTIFPTWSGQYFLPDLVGILLVTIFSTWSGQILTCNNIPYFYLLWQHYLLGLVGILLVTSFPTCPGRNPTCYIISYLVRSKSHLLRYSLPGLVWVLLVTTLPTWPGQYFYLTWSESYLWQYSLPGLVEIPRYNISYLTVTIFPTWPGRNLTCYNIPYLVCSKSYLPHWLIVLGFNDTPSFVGHVILCRLPQRKGEKR